MCAVFQTSTLSPAPVPECLALSSKRVFYLFESEDDSVPHVVLWPFVPDIYARITSHANEIAILHPPPNSPPSPLGKGCVIQLKECNLMSTGDTVRRSPGANPGPTISDYLFCEHGGVGPLFSTLLVAVCVHSMQVTYIFLSECILKQ